MGYQYVIIAVCMAVTFGQASPIMVKFGTKGGPIIPEQSTTTTAPPPGSYPSRPAPVYENQDDVPNPIVYRPLLPHQYRTKIYKYKPNPNLILGTPLDQKYTAGLSKYQKVQKAVGLGYTGPQAFGHEENYQKLDNGKRQNQVEQSQNHIEQRSNDQSTTGTRSVPQIGVVYSSGVRYYVPQFNYGYDDIDNSVYEANDLKYYYHNRKNYY